MGMKNNCVFAFGGVGGSVTKFEKKLSKEQKKKAKDCLERASKCAEMDLLGYWYNREFYSDLDKYFAEWVLTYTYDCILFEEAMNKGYQPDLLMGYSLGLNTALVCGEVITYEDGVKILEGVKECARAGFVTEEREMGIIIGITKECLVKMIHKNHFEEKVAIGSQNSEEGFIVSGCKKEILTILEQAEQAGVLKARALEVPYSFHDGKINPEYMQKYFNNVSLLDMKNAKYPIMSVYSQNIMQDAKTLREELNLNVHSSMNWNTSIKKLENMGYSRYMDISLDYTLKKISEFEREGVEFLTYKNILQ
ncbi:Malonyl CoA-acyl carrier protein transacylase [[Clostridium] polysaccharolyticum]|jgi:malonyl CoA-acyl carrier protein transacylase|uniref:[acyl-carrier-protein] S-malonyltransferase n=2 Tax=[Clostridium] polysaccharolyticum TaxID=29364 RepID=A0A1I0EDY4_9FIRM|nr:Malonyl CoA-acyl carrier protein transacylase [[Clostridium] polysaccharolyticum]